MHSQNLLLSNLPSFSQAEQLKRQTDELLCRIVWANRDTQLARTAPELAEFRRATKELVSGIDDDSLSDLFRKTVHLTTYDAYAPFIEKLFEKPCKASSIIDLLAPGLPDCLARSSTTSGVLQKFFPKYGCSLTTASSDAGSWTVSDPNRRRTTARIQYLRTESMDIEDDENCFVKKIYRCGVGIIYSRNAWNLNPEHDEERMGTFILDHAAPYAATFIANWRTFLLIHGLFAVASKSLETMSMIFISTFVDLMHHLDSEFDLVVDCIENGTIPRLDGIEEVRRYLEPNLLPDPERASELRNLGRPSSCPGWCGHVWPKLRSVAGIASGSFVSYVPLAQWYLGPNVDICSSHYGSTESFLIGSLYNPRELNFFKLERKNVIEFLEVENGDDSVCALVQPWEVEVGKRYEIVITTPDGLWRYRLEDVIEIAGFDPADGIPVMKFIERRNVVMRITHIMFTEEELRDVILSTSLVNIVDWTASIDDRWLPRTIGFFVELANDEITDLALTAPDQVVDALMRMKPQMSHRLTTDRLRKPTIRLVRTGTFSDFRQLKLDEGSRNVGQIKVPIVLPKAEYVTWFSERVVREL